MLKKIIPLALAALAAAAAFIFLQPEPTRQVWTFKTDQAAGHILTAGDLQLAEIPVSRIPTDRLLDSKQIIGQSLRTDRAGGDVVRAAYLGTPLTLGPDEREMAVKVNDSSGLAGLLKPGDRVGLTALIFEQDGAYSKVTVEGLRVLYLSSDFRVGYSNSSNAGAAGGSGGVTVVQPQQQRKTEGTVVLAVPVKMQTIAYDFGDPNHPGAGGTLVPRPVSVLELLAALNAAQNATLSLYGMPATAEPFTTSGLFLPNLILLPTATPTPTDTPAGFKATATPKK